MEANIKAEHSLTKKYRKLIWNRFIQAIRDYDLIREGDRIAVCVSGGKDSMLLAKLMQQLQRITEIPFSASYIVMDPGYTPQNRRQIEENAMRLRLPVRIFESDIFGAVDRVGGAPCYLCARMRRGHLYHYAQSIGCNKIALGHHFNDMIETVLLGILYGSQVQTMMPKVRSRNFPGMELIRPLYCVREKDIISWARYSDMHFLQCACRLTEALEVETMDSKRLLVKKLIAELKKDNPQVDINIFQSVHNVNLDTVIGYHKGDEVHSFLDEYEKGE